MGLGWQLKIGLEEGLSTTYQWFTARGTGNRALRRSDSLRHDWCSH